MNNFYISEIELIPKPCMDSLEFDEKIFCRCSFCGKKCIKNTKYSPIIDKLSPTNFHCNFCIRNNFHTKNRRDIFMISFKNIISYLYNFNYLQNKNLYLTEIKNIIKIHEITGLQNPVFYYDPESFLWFINFSKIGQSAKKIELDEVKKTLINILFCFELHKNIPHISLSNLYNDCRMKLEKFYSQRIRDGKNCNFMNSFISNKNFMYKDLQEKFFEKD